MKPLSKTVNLHVNEQRQKRHPCLYRNLETGLRPTVLKGGVMFACCLLQFLQTFLGKNS